MNKARNHRRVWTEEGMDENKRLRACASWIGSMRIFNRTAWLARDKLILKYPAWNCVRIEDKDIGFGFEACNLIEF